MIYEKIKTLIFSALLVALGAQYFVVLNTVKAETAEELQQKIEKRNSDIERLEREIANYQKEIDALSSQTATLKSTIKSLELTRKKLETNIALTQDKITSKNFEIQKIDSEISNKKGDISDNQRIISKTFLTMNEWKDVSLPELILGGRSVAETAGSLEELSLLQKGIYERIEALNKDKSALETNRTASEKAKAELLKLNNQLSDERALVLATANEQTKLLKETNESEATYKKMVEAKKAETLAFQQEISDFENQLKILINPDLIPQQGTKALRWPLDNVYITQAFGYTAFSKANLQFYKYGSHNGIDLRASIGTPVKSAASGIVTGVGDTGLVPKCLSYGRWVLVKHDNGLSTIYAHLSLASVKVGQRVSSGETIAYSGNTGASTGPHLHFGVYPTEGLEIIRFTKSNFPTSNCIGTYIPVGKALDPALYL